MVENEVRQTDHQEAGTPHHPPFPALVNGEKDCHEEKGGEKVSQPGKKKGIEQERGRDAGPSLPPDLPQEGFFFWGLPEIDLRQVNEGENPQQQSGSERKKAGARLRRGAHVQAEGPRTNGYGQD